MSYEIDFIGVSLIHAHGVEDKFYQRYCLVISLNHAHGMEHGIPYAFFGDALKATDAVWNYIFKIIFLLYSSSHTRSVEPLK